MQFLVGIFALTQGARRSWLDQAAELSQMGFIGPAMLLTAYTEMVFAPVIAAQDHVVEQIATSASSFD